MTVTWGRVVKGGRAEVVLEREPLKEKQEKGMPTKLEVQRKSKELATQVSLDASPLSQQCVITEP